MNTTKQMPSEILNIVENLIRYYLIRRRNTVIQATLELYPRMVIGLRVEGIVGIRDIPAFHRFFEKFQSNNREQSIGIWRNEWDYKLHGFGCELIHQQTKEHFDWDLGESDRFSVGEFLGHLYWRICNDRDENVENYLRWRSFVEWEGLNAIFSALEKKNVLGHTELGKWESDLELLESGDWQLNYVVFDTAEIWE